MDTSGLIILVAGVLLFVFGIFLFRDKKDNRVSRSKVNKKSKNFV